MERITDECSIVNGNNTIRNIRIKLYNYDVVKNVHTYFKNKKKCYVIQTWKDEFLVWDPSKYDNIDFIHANSKKIWMPDVISYDT